MLLFIFWNVATGWGGGAAPGNIPLKKFIATIVNNIVIKMFYYIFTMNYYEYDKTMYSLTRWIYRPTISYDALFSTFVYKYITRKWENVVCQLIILLSMILYTYYV